MSAPYLRPLLKRRALVVCGLRAASLGLGLSSQVAGQPASTPSAPSQLEMSDLDETVKSLMQAADVPGLALAVVERGTVTHARGFGFADVQAQRAVQADTVLPAASITKAVFAYACMQLAHDGAFSLDEPCAKQLKLPFGEYPEFADLHTDPRAAQITPRMLLTHSSGLLNWRWINFSRKLDIKFNPGTRYVYSGEGIQLMQLLAEERTGKSVSDLLDERVFKRFGMANSALTWRSDFESRAANRYDANGRPLGISRRDRARAAGSMATTAHDLALFMQGLMRARAAQDPSLQAMLEPRVPIVSPRQFPSHFPGSTDAYRSLSLAAAHGWVSYRSPLGPAVFKEGNDDGTNNFCIWFTERELAIVMLSNSSRADRMFVHALDAIAGKACLPWFWMNYVPWDRPEWRGKSYDALPPEACTV